MLTEHIKKELYSQSRIKSIKYRRLVKYYKQINIKISKEIVSCSIFIKIKIRWLIINLF